MKNPPSSCSPPSTIRDSGKTDLNNPYGRISAAETFVDTHVGTQAACLISASFPHSLFLHRSAPWQPWILGLCTLYAQHTLEGTEWKEANVCPGSNAGSFGPKVPGSQIIEFGLEGGRSALSMVGPVGRIPGRNKLEQGPIK